MNERESWLFLGGSRGLGKALIEETVAQFSKSKGEAHPHFFVASRFRKPWNEGELSLVTQVVADFSQDSGVETILQLFRQQKFHRIFYFAGGGPYGNFFAKKKPMSTAPLIAWKDHHWAIQVSFLACARFLHASIHDSVAPPLQWIVIGSSIAENKPDAKASAYCAGKHALRGFLTTLQQDQEDFSHEISSAKPALDLRLVSPGYMDTELIPQGVALRSLQEQSKAQLLNPTDLAKMLLAWILDESNTGQNLEI